MTSYTLFTCWILAMEFQAGSNVCPLPSNSCFCGLDFILSTACVSSTAGVPPDHVSVVSRTKNTSICATCGGTPVTSITKLDQCVMNRTKDIVSAVAWVNEGFGDSMENSSYQFTLCQYGANIKKVEPIESTEYCYYLTGLQCPSAISSITKFNTTCTEHNNATFSLTFRRCNEPLETHMTTDQQLLTTTGTKQSIQTTRPESTTSLLTTDESETLSSGNVATSEMTTRQSSQKSPTTVGDETTATPSITNKFFASTNYVATSTTSTKRSPQELPTTVEDGTTAVSLTTALTNYDLTSEIYTEQSPQELPRTVEEGTTAVSFTTALTNYDATSEMSTKQSLQKLPATIEDKTTAALITANKSSVSFNHYAMSSEMSTITIGYQTTAAVLTTDRSSVSSDDSVTDVTVLMKTSTSGRPVLSIQEIVRLLTNIGNPHYDNSLNPLESGILADDPDVHIVIVNSTFPLPATLPVFSKSSVLKINVTSGNLTEDGYMVSLVQFRLAYDVFDRILRQSTSQIGKVSGSESQISKIYLAPTNTPILSISLYYDIEGNVPAAVEYKIDVSGDVVLLDHFGQQLCAAGVGDTTIIQDTSYECAYIDVDKLVFSTEGCSRVAEENSEIVCSCSHTTVFAVLLSATIVVIPQGVKITSYIAESLSVIFLSITIIVLLRLRKMLRGDRPMVQINLAVSLLFLHLVSLLHDRALQAAALCEMTAVLTHIFLLSSAMWMLLEGVTLLTKTLNSALRFSENKRKAVTIMRLTAGWLLPGVVVLISSVVGFTQTNYLSPSLLYQKGVASNIHEIVCDGQNDTSRATIPKYDVCWVTSTHFLLQGSVIIPLSIIFFLNFVICIRVASFVYRMTVKAVSFRPTNDRHIDADHVKAVFKAVLLLLPVLGMPWVVGFFTGVSDRATSIVFMYTNAIINGLQGFLLFFLYCVVSEEVRNAFRLSLAKGKVNFSNYIDISKRKMSAFSTNTNVRLKAPVGVLESERLDYQSQQL